MRTAHIRYGNGFTLSVLLLLAGLAWDLYLIVRPRILAGDNPQKVSAS